MEMCNLKQFEILSCVNWNHIPFIVKYIVDSHALQKVLAQTMTENGPYDI